MTIELTDDEGHQLLVALGYALSAAMRQGQEELVVKFLLIINEVGASFPDFVPYK